MPTLLASDAVAVGGARCRLRLSRYSRGATMAPHEHAESNVSVVLSGAVIEHVGGRTEVARAGSVVRKEAGTRHANRFGDGGAVLFSLEIAGAERLPDGCDDVASTWSWTHGGPVARAALGLWRRWLRAPDEAGAILETGVYELAASLESEPVGRCVPPWVTHARDQLLASLAAPPRVRELAGAAGVHPVYFTRRFREHFGCSVIGFVQRERIRAALAALGDRSRPLARIAADLGFADESHLSRVFQREAGVRPGEYRRAINAIPLAAAS